MDNKLGSSFYYCSVGAVEVLETVSAADMTAAETAVDAATHVLHRQM